MRFILIFFLSLSVYSMTAENVTIQGVTMENGTSDPTVVTFGAFSDVHYESNGSDETGIANLQSLISTIWNKNIDTDFVICVGDQTTGNATASDGLADALAVDTAMSAFNGDTYAVVGNHEFGIQASYISATDTMLGSDHGYYSVDKNGIHFIFLNSTDATYYSMSQEQLDWLEDNLASSLIPTIVFIHHRVDKDYGDPADWWPSDPQSIYSYNSATLRAMFEADGDVTTVFSGHYHGQTQTIINGIKYITVPACASSPYGLTVDVKKSGAVSVTTHGFSSTIF